MEITVPVSVGEYFDKYSILSIKSIKLTDAKKLAYVKKEKLALETKMEGLEHVLQSEPYRRLYEINLQLWDIEDNIRQKEKVSLFDDSFIQLSRSIYFLNDERFNCKNAISVLVGSTYKEQKSHTTCVGVE